MRRLRDRVAVVTGAASGIGRATAIELARQGCHLALVTRRNREGLEETGRQVEALGRNASLHRADVSDRPRMAALPSEVLAAHRQVHILVNNAGVTVMAELDGHTLEDLDWIVGTNLWGALHGTYFFLPHLKRQQEGHIVNVSSLQGLLALPAQASYAATKFALRGFGEALRGELAPHGIGVTTVYPGLIRTNIVASARVRGEEQEKLREWLGGYVATRTLAPEKCARRIVGGIRRNRARVRITAAAHLADWSKRLFPTATDTVVAALQRARPS